MFNFNDKSLRAWYSVLMTWFITLVVTTVVIAYGTFERQEYETAIFSGLKTAPTKLDRSLEDNGYTESKHASSSIILRASSAEHLACDYVTTSKDGVCVAVCVESSTDKAACTVWMNEEQSGVNLECDMASESCLQLGNTAWGYDG